MSKRLLMQIKIGACTLPTVTIRNPIKMNIKTSTVQLVQSPSGQKQTHAIIVMFISRDLLNYFEHKSYDICLLCLSNIRVTAGGCHATQPGKVARYDFQS